MNGFPRLAPRQGFAAVTRRVAAWSLCALAIVATLATTERNACAQESGRSVAVLEYRGGTAALANIGDTATEALRKTTRLTLKDPAAMREALGGKLDGEVAACRGEVACLGVLGRKLGVEEILLIGVSEFGDVILTIQRIQTKPAKVLSRVADALAADASVDSPAVLTYLQRVLPASDFLRYGHLRVVSDVAQASVHINGKAKGKTPLAPIEVEAPARYEIVVNKPGYVAFRATVAVPPGAEVEVRPSLSRIASTPWWRSWWATTIVGTVVLGATATAIVLTRDAPSEVPVTGVFPQASFQF